MKTEIKIHKVGDCYEITENGFTRQLTGDFTIGIFDGWVACSDRLPEEGETVIIWDGDDSTHAVFKGGKFYQDISWCSTTGPCGYGIDNEIGKAWVTNWRPLPSPPLTKDSE